MEEKYFALARFVLKNTYYSAYYSAYLLSIYKCSYFVFFPQELRLS